MRWIWRIGCVALVGWVLFLASPFVALYRLAAAIEARDAAAIAGRVNARAIRVSLLDQLIDEYLRGLPLDPERRRAAATAGNALAEPIAERIATPEALLDLLGKGPAGDGAGPDEPGPGLAGSFGTLYGAAQLFAASETRGFRKILIPLPSDAPRAEAFVLSFRLQGTTWRLTAIDLPDQVRRRLVRGLPRPNA